MKYSAPEFMGALPPELEELKQLVRGVVQRECIPLESKFLTHRPGDEPDPKGGAWLETPTTRNETLVDGALTQADWDRLTRISKETGLYSATLPEEYGGFGFGVLGSFVIAEEFKRSVVPLPVPEAPPVLFDCSEIQREKYLEPTIRGEKEYCFCQTEPDAGSDPGSMRTTAVREGDEWVINGTKTFISRADRATYQLVLAVTDPEKRQHGGITMFIVDADTPGITLAPIDTWLAQKAGQFTITYDNVRVPAENLVGEEGGGFRLGQSWLIISDRLTRGSMATGFLTRGLEMAVEWSKARETFGKPIAERQAIQWMLVDVFLDIKAIRAMSYECATRADRGEDVRTYAAAAKFMGGNWGHRSMDNIMQILGGMGEVLESPISHWYRGLRHGRIGGGTDEIQKMLMARAILNQGVSLWEA
ncbi:acyl-CoA dehydrogenase family protein [Nocardioides sp.]|uniref:acyl-CoA dehydrogenase family protein n=1 Tax=Nocardioides sp. TaxID=35761 RepID=UPI003D136611